MVEFVLLDDSATINGIVGFVRCHVFNLSDMQLKYCSSLGCVLLDDEYENIILLQSNLFLYYLTFYFFSYSCILFPYFE